MQNGEQIAILSDIHSNRYALQAVLADIARQGITRIYNLGDCVYGPLEPAQTADILMTTPIISIRGNQDRFLASPTDELMHNETYRRVIEQLTDKQQLWLLGLPVSMVIDDEIYACHGNDVQDDLPLIEKITASGVELRSDQELIEATQNIPYAVILCAHTHVPRTQYISNGTLIINPGSVGLPAYEDDLPFPHVMESGSPHAKYAILSKSDNKYHVNHRLVTYDWHTASAQAAEHHRPDWEYALLTGRHFAQATDTDHES